MTILSRKERSHASQINVRTVYLAFQVFGLPEGKDVCRFIVMSLGCSDLPRP